MIYDYFRVIGAHDTVLHHADLYNRTLRNDDVQESIRGETKKNFFETMRNLPTDDVLESLYKLRIRESVNSKTVLELFAHLKLIKMISKPDCQKVEDHGEERFWSKDQITKPRSQRPERGSTQEQWSRIAVTHAVLKEDKESAINGKQKDSV